MLHCYNANIIFAVLKILLDIGAKNVYAHCSKLPQITAYLLTTFMASVHVFSDKRLKRDYSEQPKVITAQQMEVVRLVGMGMTNRQVARELKLDDQTVSTICRYEWAQEKLQEIQNARNEQAGEISEHIKEAAEAAVELSRDIIKGSVEHPDTGEVQFPSLALRQKTASDMMNRYPLSVPKPAVGGEEPLVKPNEIPSMIAKALQFGIAAGGQQARVEQLNENSEVANYTEVESE